MVDCFGNFIIVCNSDFVDFVGEDILEGNGLVVGVFFVFGIMVQLMFCNIDDV